MTVETLIETSSMDSLTSLALVFLVVFVFMLPIPFVLGYGMPDFIGKALRTIWYMIPRITVIRNDKK